MGSTRSSLANRRTGSLEDTPLLRAWPIAALVALGACPGPNKSVLDSGDASRGGGARPREAGPGPDKRQDATPPAKTPQPFGAALAQEIGNGGPVAVLASDAGVVARNVAGDKKRTLVPGPVSWVSCDNKSQVLWFVRSTGREESQLLLIDLLEADPKPEPIVVRLPLDEPVLIDYPDDRLSVFPAGVTATILSLKGKEPSLANEPGLAGEFGGGVPEHDRLLAKAKLAPKARARLAEVTARNPRARPSGPTQEALPKFPIDPQRCDGYEDKCGRTIPVPMTKLWVVTTRIKCSDSCYFEKQFYNPSTHEFYDPVTGARSRTPIEAASGEPLSVARAWVAPNGEAFILDGRVVRLDGGEVRHEAGAVRNDSGGGWLGGGWRVPEF